ncbi:MAG: YceI family protein [Planctomycetaceae bacterium]
MSRRNWALLISGCTFIGGCSPQPQPVAETATVAEMKPAEMAPAAESAAPAADGAAQAETAPAGTMALSPANAQIQFVGKHTDDKPDRVGVFTEFTGQAAIDPATHTLTAVSVDIPISSVATAFDKLTDHLKSPDFFDAREHPTAKFESTSIAAGEQPGQQVVNGKLTLMGTTKDVSFPADVTVADGMVKLTGHLTIKRSEYGMNKMLEGVKDEVDLNVSIGEPTQKPTGG